jgi:preprotein translocase subunit YajC
VSGYIFIIALLALMYFMLIRPQGRRKQEQQRLLDTIAVGKEIVTAGGLYGTITAVDGDEVRLEVADGVEVRIARRAVAGVVSDDEAPDEEPDETPDEETPATLPHDSA